MNKLKSRVLSTIIVISFILSGCTEETENISVVPTRAIGLIATFDGDMTKTDDEVVFDKNKKGEELTVSCTPVPTPTATNTPTPTATNTPTPTATNTPTPTATNTPTPTATNTPTPMATNTPTPTATNTPTPTATNTPTPTATNTPTPTATNTPTPTPRFDTATMSAEKYEFLSAFRDYTNTEVVLSGSWTEVNTLEEGDRAVLDGAIRNSGWSWKVFYNNVEAIRTPAEYKALYPEITEINADMENCVVYANGYVVTFSIIRGVTAIPFKYYARTGGDFLFYDYKNGTRTFNDNGRAFELAKNVMSQLGVNGRSEVEIIKAVHDYLVLNTAYDYHLVYGGSDQTCPTYGMESHTVLGTLKNHYAVCDGYSDTFEMFMALYGIECIGVVGNNHKWNQVKVDGDWYHIDCTWDDPLVMNDALGHDADVPASVSYKYFLVPDNGIYGDVEHTLEAGQNIHTCTSTRFGMYAFRNYIINSLGDVYSVYESQRGKETTVFAYSTDSGITEQDIFNYLAQSVGISQFSYYPVYQKAGYNILELLN